MSILVYIIGGLFAGAAAGMGMGGGSILIPILTLLAGLGQHAAQGANMLAFIPSAIAAIIIHKRAGRVRFKESLPVILCGLVFAALGAFAAMKIKGDTLRLIFALFLVCLSVEQFIEGERSYKKEKQRNTGEKKQRLSK